MPKPKTDKDFLERLKQHAPEALDADVDFGKVVSHIIRVDPDRIGLRDRRKRKRRVTSNSKRKRTSTK